MGGRRLLLDGSSAHRSNLLSATLNIDQGTPFTFDALGYDLMCMPVTSDDDSRRPSLCLVTAVPVTCNAFLGAHVAALSPHAGVTLVHSGLPEDLRPEIRALARSIRVRIRREISPWSDLRAMFALWRLFRRERFELVHSVTPKAGLLTAIAARLAGVPVRLHWFTGQVWATRRGAMRWLLRALDRIVAASSTCCLVDSPSQRDFLLSQGVGCSDRLRVLASGSVNGVDARRFRPDSDARGRIRASLGVPEGAVMALFVGRLGSEKGVPELARAFAVAARACPNLHLALVGPDEEGLEADLRRDTREMQDRVHVCGATREPEAFMAAADFLVLPSHREGFGSVVIEAAACGLPAVATRIYGLSDAVEDGRTGTLVPPYDEVALSEAIRRMAQDAEARRSMGDAALQRAREEFPQERLTSALLELYAQLLGRRMDDPARSAA